MSRLILVSLAALFLSAMPAGAQQMVDPDYAPVIEHPAYAEQGPFVAIDEAHRNFHTLAGRYAPFAKLLGADGYRVAASATSLSAQTLASIRMLVIANARGVPPEVSAFTAGEIAAVKAWVEGGGSLLLIADHAPFGTAAADLARAFGVEMGQGYVGVHEGGKVTFAIDFADGQLGNHPIRHGRGKDEEVRHVRSFTGQSLGVPDGAISLLNLPADALEVAGPSQAMALLKGDAATGTPASGRSQAMAMTVGKGRLVVAGEAAMFSAQVVPRPGQPPHHMGLTIEDDQQFALNIVHWLSRLID